MSFQTKHDEFPCQNLFVSSLVVNMKQPLLSANILILGEYFNMDYSESDGLLMTTDSILHDLFCLYSSF